MSGGAPRAKKWPFVTAVAMLASAWALLHSLSHAEPMVTKKPFSDFPVALPGGWEGREISMDQEILKALKPTDHMLRSYVRTLPGPEAIQRVSSTERSLPVLLYAGFYGSQRTGLTYHSPKNCLPGSGWQVIEADYVTVSPQAIPPVTINKILIQKGLDKQLILYWYHDRGRVIATELDGKLYLVWDAVTKNRTDGALVRISVPVTDSADISLEHGLSFLEDVWPVLADYMPPG